MYQGLKRIIDFLLSLLGIIISSPIWLITIIGIEINDPGPIFYMASRIGKEDKEFKMFKFRSMRVLKEPKVGSEASLRPEEARIFAWGKVIRKLKIDEIPQLLNIFIGNMAIVGPRPVAKDQMSIFRVGRYDEAKKVRPGLTGPAALYDYIYGDQFEDFDLEAYMEKILPTRRELELVYLKKMSFSFDIWMFFETAWCVICSASGKENKKLLEKLIDMAKENNPELEKSPVCQSDKSVENGVRIEYGL